MQFLHFLPSIWFFDGSSQQQLPGQTQSNILLVICIFLCLRLHLLYLALNLPVMVVLNSQTSVPVAARPTGLEGMPISKMSHLQGHQVPMQCQVRNLRNYVPARKVAGAHEVQFLPVGARNWGSYMPAPVVGGTHRVQVLPGAAAPLEPLGHVHRVPAPVGHVSVPAGSSYLPSAPVRGAGVPVSHVPPNLQSLVNQLMPPIEFKFYPDLRPSDEADVSTTQRTIQFVRPVKHASAQKMRTGEATTSFLPPQSFVSPPEQPGIRKLKGSCQTEPSSKQPALMQHMALSHNKICADCGEPWPEWASVNLGVTICIECAGCHRSLGAHVSKVKSLTLDNYGQLEARRS